MDDATEREWDKLEDDWNGARLRLDEHWDRGDERSHDANWRRELQQLEADERAAGDAFMQFAREVVRGQPTPRIHLRYDGGPNDGRDDWFPPGTSTIGANERIDGEVQAAPGAYQRTSERDDAGLVIFRWIPNAP